MNYPASYTSTVSVPLPDDDAAHYTAR